MAINVAFAGLAVAQLDAAIEWYERLLGRPADMVPNDDEVTWELVEGGWIYVVRDPPRAGNALLTLIVDDLDEQIATLAERGIETGEIEEAAGLFRRVALADPAGNRITFAETAR